MGEKTLVESQIADSIELMKQLDSTGHAPSIAAWYFYDDVDEWRLLISGAIYDDHLPKQETLAYQMIAEAISDKELSSITISEVKLMRSDEPLMQTMKFLIGTGPTGITRAHFIDTTVNAIFIKEMIILRSA